MKVRSKLKREDILSLFERQDFTPDTRARISEAMRKKWQDPEYKAKLMVVLQERPHVHAVHDGRFGFAPKKKPDEPSV